MRRRTALIAIAAFTAGLLAHGIAEAKSGKSGGGGRSGVRSGDWHSGAHYRGGHYSQHRGGHGAYRSRFHASGLFVGAPVPGAGYGVYPYYGAANAPAWEPVYYIEKTDGYWYYCVEAERYYPDVEQCESPWLAVQGWMRAPAP